MNLSRIAGLGMALALGIAGGCASGNRKEETVPPKPAASVPQPGAGYVVIPKEKDNDLKLYYPGGKVIIGADALGLVRQEADVYASVNPGHLKTLKTAGLTSTYAKFGFVKAASDELKFKPIP